MSTRVPSGVGRWAPLRAFVERSKTVPLLHFSLGFKDSETLLARRARVHSPPEGEVLSLGSACRLPRASRAPFRVLHERLTSDNTRSLQTGRSRSGARKELPITRGVPVPRYSARRTRALHSDPKVRALNSSGPGFSPVARLACRVVLRSCFRPGTRLGLPRLPPRATFHPMRDRVCGPGTRPGPR
jgi:hypothetical protein